MKLEEAIKSIKREYNNALAPTSEEEAIINLLQSQQQKIDELIKEVENLKGANKYERQQIGEIKKHEKKIRVRMAKENQQLKQENEQLRGMDEHAIKFADLCVYNRLERSEIRGHYEKFKQQLED